MCHGCVSRVLAASKYAAARLKCPHNSFNPKPEAMAASGMDRPHAAPAIASGFGLNEDS